MKCRPEEYRYSTAHDSARGAAEAVAAALARALQWRERVSLAVSGGRSPVPFLEYLSAQPLDWPRVSVTLVDERWVAPDSEDSNEALVRRHLLREAAAAAEFLPLKTAAPNAAAALAERSAALPPTLDVVVLGMGMDGHIASLFPGAPGIEAALDAASQQRLVAIEPPQAPHGRISLSMGELCRAGAVFMQFQGIAKLAVYSRACAGDVSLPIGVLLQALPKPLQVHISD